VALAESVFSAVSRFQQNPADLVVLGLDGLEERDLEVVRVLREIRPEVYVLLAFPSPLRDRAVKALAIGADSYILEPFYLGEFLDFVRRGLERTRRARRVPPGTEGEDLERLAAAVAHAVRNPLQIIELMLSDDAEGETDPSDVREETDRVNEVVKELIGFAHRARIDRSTVSLNDVMKEIVHPPGGRLRRVRRDLAPDLPPISGDPERLRAAFGALASLSGEDGRLEVRTEITPRGRLRATVRLADLTLSEDERDALFLPFRSRVPGTVGLAAATAKATFDAHDAETAVQSRDGDGTTVRIDFPVVEGAPRREGERARGKGD